MPEVNFVGIGAQKAATTWLYNVLSEHSMVTTSEFKELNFFTANYDRGYIWYENCFAKEPTENIKGECSPNYFISHDAARRAWKYNRDLKLICILRDPIDRAFSNHLHEIRKCHIAPSTSFEVALAKNPSYLQQSHYKMNLEYWLEYFAHDAFLILFSEDISTNPEKAYDQICHHLDIAQGARPTTISERHHENVAYKSPKIQKFLRHGGDTMRLLGMEGFVKSLKNVPTLKKTLSFNKQHLKTKIKPPTLETRLMMTDQFRQDIEFVANITGRKELPWPTWRELCKNLTINIE